MNYRWKPEETEYLISLIGYYSTREIVKRVCKKYPHIAPQKIEDKTHRTAQSLGESIREKVDNYNLYQLSKLLGIPTVRIQRWLKHGLKTKKDGFMHMIKHKDLIDFAKANPRRLADLPRDRLEWLFQGRKDLVEYVLSSPPMKTPAKKVYCVTEDKTYPSLTTAAKVYGTSREKIMRSANNQIPAKIGDKYLKFQWG